MDPRGGLFVFRAALKTAWADFGSQTFATKATCASLDEKAVGSKLQMFNSGAQTGPGD